MSTNYRTTYVVVHDVRVRVRDDFNCSIYERLIQILRLGPWKKNAYLPPDCIHEQAPGLHPKVLRCTHDKPGEFAPVRRPKPSVGKYLLMSDLNANPNPYTDPRQIENPWMCTVQRVSSALFVRFWFE